MSEEKTISVQVEILGRPYPLKVRPEEEARIQEAAAMIDDKVKVLQEQFEAKDKQDYLAMCALTYVVELIGQQAAPSADNTDLSGKLDELDNVLSEFLER